MSPDELAQRQRVVAVARTFLRTPYHSGGRVKGGGVDCLTVIAAVFEEAGLVPPIDIPPYHPEWHLHQSAELYLEGLLKYTREIPGPPQPGDIVLWKFGRCYSHGAIVINWPQIIHAYMGRCVTLESAEAPWLTHIGENVAEKGRPRSKKYFSLWGK